MTVLMPTGRSLVSVLSINRDDDVKHLEDADYCALMSEVSLAEAWSRPEEDAAWSYLLPAFSIDRTGESLSP